MDSHFEIQTAAVVGLGLMGGSFAKRLKEIGVRVIGINRTRSVAEEALAQGAVDTIDMAELNEADAVIFTTPAEATENFIRQHVKEFKSGAVLTDIAGVKNYNWDALHDFLPKDLDFVSGHPMCGREGEGFARSDGTIFDRANYVLIPHEKNRPESLDAVEALARRLGCSYVPRVTAAEHDRHISFTSDLTHVIAPALILSASFNENTKYFAGGSFIGETRVADNNPAMWTQLFFENRENLLEDIDRFMVSVANFRDALAASDAERTAELLGEAARRRKDLMKRD